MYLIDTNILAEVMNPAGNAEVQRWFDVHLAEAHLPTPVIFETLAGLASLPDGARQRQLLAFFDRVIQRFGPRLAAFDLAAARAAARLTGAARRQGRVLTRMDAQIAGIASAYDLVLVTRNTRDFDGLDLKQKNPWGQGA
jgi:toxin FitB